MSAPTPMITSMATDMRVLEPPDWRLDIAGIQASIRRLPNDSNLTLAVDEIVDILDAIPGPKKFVPEPDAYTLVSFSGTSRPDRGSNREMVFDGADVMFTDTALDTDYAERVFAHGSYTVYIAGPLAAITASGGLFFCANGPDYTNMFGAYSNGTGFRHYNIGQGNNASSGFHAVDKVLALTWGGVGTAPRIYADGTLAETSAVQSTLWSNLNRMELGDYGGNPGLNGSLNEVLCCLGEHDATTVATVTAQLIADYNL